jgi:hypothetical protein
MQAAPVAQSAVVAHDDPHIGAVATQRYGAQSPMTAPSKVSTQSAEPPLQKSCASQVLLASRQSVPAAAKPSPGHTGATPSQVSATSQSPADTRQSVPAFAVWHAPPPSQKPAPHGPAAHSSSGSAPAGTGAHCPSDSPVTLATHASQPLSQALSQQTPSTHDPLSHALSAAQVAPSGSSGTPLSMSGVTPVSPVPASKGASAALPHPKEKSAAAAQRVSATLARGRGASDMGTSMGRERAR